MACVPAAVAITVAWAIQTLISTVQSAIRGGLMVSRGAMALLCENGVIELEADETMLDEYTGWALAAIGVLVQLRTGFALPFPANLYLWPLDVAELYLKAKVMEDV